MSAFDPAHHGLESHYTREQQEIIRRLILEDWKTSDVKLPTYMKLVARYIIPLGVPDDWLKKLIHQTMSKMLTGQSTPRYAFWACLHLYLMKKYGDIGLSTRSSSDIALLGQAVARFGKNQNPTLKAGAYRLNDHTVMALDHSSGFIRLAMIEQSCCDEPFSETATIIHEGAAINQSNELVGLIRKQIDKHLTPLQINCADFQPLDDVHWHKRLHRLMSAI